VTLTNDCAWRTFADLLDPPDNPYVRDPVGWVTSTLGEFWWSGQHRMAQSVVENRYSAFKASHDVSKSHTMSRLALWWIDVHPPGEAFVVTTAPTTPQVEAILWRYMGNAHKRAELAGRITLDAKWYIGNELVAYGPKPADYDPAAFQGIHARYVLVIIDEAGGEPKSIFDAVDALATNVDARVVAVGNRTIPRRRDLQARLWLARGNDQRVRHPGVHRREGPGGPAATARLTGVGGRTQDPLGRHQPDLPIQGPRRVPGHLRCSLILPRWIEAAQKRTLERTRRPIIAADIARFGEDETVIMRCEGGWIRTYQPTTMTTP
jgi:hypothetical protein